MRKGRRGVGGVVGDVERRAGMKLNEIGLVTRTIEGHVKNIVKADCTRYLEAATAKPT